MQNYVALSIETHLFFARIMKEHALFLEAGFPCKEECWIEKADWFREQFENLLRDTVRISNGRIGNCIINSNEIVTEFTIPAERRTESLSGVPIDSRISMMQQRLRPGCVRNNSRQLFEAVHRLNEQSIELLNGLIEFKEDILEEVGRCRLFTTNYPLLIEHILREAKLYRATIQDLMNGKCTSHQDMRATEEFWNQIMMEHALFIRGLLDPSEEELIDTADDFAENYKELLEMARCQNLRSMDELTRKSLEETLKYRDFKAAGARGILNCEIASIILPLLADHVLREANHYIRLLDCEQ